MLASGSIDNSIKIWDTDKGRLVRTIKASKDWVISLTVLKNGYLVSGGGRGDPNIKIWDTNFENGLIVTLTGHSHGIFYLIQLPNGNLASASADKSIKLWDTSSWQLIKTLTGHSDWIGRLAILKNDNLVSGSRDKIIKIWDTSSGNEIETIDGGSEIDSVIVTKSGLIISSLENGLIKIWE